jgi:acyl-CoA reductase-like NAD-dependent aldehyde dehydrogenase
MSFDKSLESEIKNILSQGPIAGLAGGEELMSSTGDTFDVKDPGSGEKLAEVHNLQAEDVDRAVELAGQAFENAEWAGLPVNERCVYLHRLADEVENRKPLISHLESMDCGKILVQAEDDVQNFIDTMRYFADLAQNTQLRTVLAVKGHEAAYARHPWGVCGSIVPWNFPFLLCGWGIAPALAAGNTVVVKPAEDTPLTTLYLARMVKEIGFPDGVLNVVPGLGGVTGAALSANSKLSRMSFTGSPDVGRLVAAECGRNLVPVKLELGGKGAAVVFDDVDVPEAAQKLVEAITFHTGQVCCDATRWLVQKPVYDEFVNEVSERMQKVVIGYPSDEGSAMGPVVSEKQKDRVLGYLEKGIGEGAEVVLEGGAAEVEGRPDGYYVKPALLAGSLDNVAAREEIFGPVAYLSPFDSESEGLTKANDTPYGLANSVWSSDLSRCRRVAESFEAGNGWINSHNVVVHGVPYGGVKQSGMGGGVGSLETLLDYYRGISVIRPL